MVVINYNYYMLERHGPKKIDTTRDGKVAAAVAYVIATPFLLAAVGIIGMQVVGYLQYGEWSPLPVMPFFEMWFPWLDNPQSWLGLHRIVHGLLNGLPVSLLLLFIAWIFWAIGNSQREQ